MSCVYKYVVYFLFVFIIIPENILVQCVTVTAYHTAQPHESVTVTAYHTA